MKNIRAIIPAAGKGTRLNAGETPKAMYRALGRPLIETVLVNTAFIEPKDTYIVVGYKKEKIIEYFGDKYNYVEQTEQLGTGHAIMVCKDAFEGFDGTVLVTFGDMPLFRHDVMKAMCEAHEAHGADCTLMSAYNDLLADHWAHIVRGSDGEFDAIVEGSDCTPEQLAEKELFAGVLVFNAKSLFDVLPKLKTENAQHEYYLTEVPELMKKLGMKVETYLTDDPDDLRGVNTREDLEICEKIMQQRNAQN